MKINPKIFEGFDIRGKHPKDINPEIAKQIAKAIAIFLKPKSMVIGRDIRESSENIHQSVINGLIESGVNVIDIGVVSTEMLYFAVPHLNAGGGIVLTASHNPIGWAGIKIVRKEAKPVSTNTGLGKIADLTQTNLSKNTSKPGKLIKKDISLDYYQKIELLADISKIKPLNIVIDAMNGIAGKMAEPILEKLPCIIHRLNFKPKPSYPEGDPNPILTKRQNEIKVEITKVKANLGAAFDGDGDRIVFFDEKGNFIPNCYIVALLAKNILEKNNNKGKIIHETRLTWIIKDLVKKAGGTPVEIKVGNPFFKEEMRKEKAIFAGESTGHFFYDEFNYSDAALLTLLYVLDLFSQENKPVSEIIQILKDQVSVMIEVNFKIDNPAKLLKEIEKKFKPIKAQHIDGITIETDDYRFNIRSSQTQPLVRLNLETHNKELLKSKKTELISFIKSQGGKINN